MTIEFRSRLGSAIAAGIIVGLHVKLAGTISLPKGKAPFPAVLLIAAAGSEAVPEFATIEESISAVALKVIGDWIQIRLR